MAEPKGDKPFQDLKLADSTKIVETAEAEPCAALAVVDVVVDSVVDASGLVVGPNLGKDSGKDFGKSDSSDAQAAQVAQWLAAESHTFVAPPYGGLRRHRLILAGCALLALSILLLSTANLKPLMKTSGEIDSNFKLTLEPEKPKLSPDLVYASDAELRDGLIRVCENKWGSNKVGFVDAKGKVVIAPKFYSAEDFKDGLCVFKKEAEKEPLGPNLPGKVKRSDPSITFGVIDKTGKQIFEPRFTRIYNFDHGVALAEIGDVTMLLDKTGKILFTSENMVVPKKKPPLTENATVSDFDDMERMADGSYMQQVYDPYSTLFSGNLVNFSLSNRLEGLLDRSGRVVVQPIYDKIFTATKDAYHGFKSPHSAHLDSTKVLPTFFVVKDSKWGVLDAAGKELFPPKFKRILSYQNDHAAVLVGEKYGFADAKGNIVIKPEYDFVTAFDKIIAVKKNEVWSFIDATGKPIVTPPIDGIVHSGRGVWLSDGLGQVVKDNKVGFFNTKGQFALKPQFEWALAFENGFAPVFEKGFWHYIDTSGKNVSANFVSANSLVDGRSLVSVPGPLYSFLRLVDGYPMEQEFKKWHNVAAGRKSDSSEEEFNGP